MSTTMYHDADEPEPEPEKNLNETEQEDLNEPAQKETENQQIADRIEELKIYLPTIRAEVVSYLFPRVEEITKKVVEKISRAILSPLDDLEFTNLRNLDIPTADIESNCDELKSQIKLNRYQGQLPCADLGQEIFVPISEAEFISNGKYQDNNLEELHFLDHETAVDNFGTRLSNFLTHRVVSTFLFPPWRPRVGGMSDTPLLLPIRVFSPTIGARVSYSPIYFVNYIVLSAPTSPAIGSILPGRYKFMISKRPYKEYDDGIFDIPDSFDVNLQV